MASNKTTTLKSHYAYNVNKLQDTRPPRMRQCSPILGMRWGVWDLNTVVAMPSKKLYPNLTVNYGKCVVNRVNVW